MSFVLIPLSAYLLLYAPGRFLLHRAGDTAAVGSRLFREILLSACCTSWLGFTLAELGLYGLPALLAGNAIVSLAARLLARHGSPHPYTRADLAGIGIFLLGCTWAAPPLDTRVLGADSAAYVASGVHLSRHGSLIVRDPTLPLLSPDLKRGLFPSVAPDRGSPPYLRLPGSHVMRSLDSDAVLPAFHHLIAVWIAIFHELGGSPGTLWVITLFAGLSLWAMTEFAREAGGLGVALIFLALLLLLAPQSWYSRFLMPEVPGQYYVWGGLACFSAWWRTRTPRNGALAGAALGIAGLMRVENAAFLAFALIVALFAAPPGARRALCLPLGTAALIWAHGALHLAVFKTHYFGNLASLLPHNLRDASAYLLAAVLVAGGGFLLWKRLQRPQVTKHRWLHYLVVAVLVAAVLGADYLRGWETVRLLAAYTGPVTLAAGGCGLLLSLTQLDERRAGYRLFVILAAVTLAQVMVQSHVTPVPIWAVRRAVTIVLPAFCLGVALLAQATAQRWHWLPALVIVVAAAGGEFVPLRSLRDQSHYRGGLQHVRSLATLVAPPAALLFDARLVALGFAPALWSEHDLPAYFLSPHDGARIRELVRSLEDLPVYWVGDGTVAPAQGDGLAVTGVALYQFGLSTPAMELGSPPGASTHSTYTVGLYRLASEPR